MKAVVFNVHLQEPLLATQANSAEPNSSISYAYIPGGMIRGALVGNYVREKKVADLASDAAGYQLFLSGQVRYLNGYLFHRQRLLPKPLSWLVEKGQEKEVDSKIYDFAIREEQEQLERPKSPSGQFVHYAKENVWLASPERQVQVHNASTEPGRKAAGISQVYRYDALAAEQIFQAIILADDGVDINPLTKLLEQKHFVLGRSSTSGYGLVKIEDVQEESAWQEYIEENSQNDFYIITCLSDLILRDANGQVSSALSHVLGLSSSDIIAFQKLHLVGGFNNKWGLPLPQAMAIQAGSVFRIPKGAIKEKSLRDYVEKGIGERTVEGYGRIALNLHTQPTRARTKSPSAHSELPPTLSDSSRDLAQIMAKRQLRQQLEQQLKVIVRQHAKFANLPSRTQLSRVRLVARQALAKEDITLITTHMDGIKGAKSSWDKARLNNRRLFDWLKEYSTLNGADFVQLFNLAGKLPTVAGEKGEMDNQLETEFRARLIDGVMKQAVLQQQAEKKQLARSSS